MIAQARNPLGTLLLAVTLLAVAHPASAAASPLDGRLQRLELLERQALDRLGRARELMATGGLTGAVRSAAFLAGVTPVSPEPVPVAVPGVPSPIAAPVARLVGAMRVAEALASRAITAPPETVRRLARELDRLMPLAMDPDVSGRIRRLRANASAAIDPSASLTGALLMARAIDQALPELMAYGSSLPRSSTEIAGCEVLDQPNMCVGGAGPNTYDRDVPLLIDLGGDDVHTHSAGAAGTGAVNPPGNGMAVSVTIDAGGNDRYESASPHGTTWGVQGFGMDGAIGILVDSVGNDTYRVTGAAERGLARGHGLGATGGTGILFDGTGDDTYEIAHTLPGGRVNGQGVGVFAGTGISVDAAGADSYRLASRPAAPTVTETEFETTVDARASAQGFGNAGLGVGLFSDGGGADRLSLESVAATIPPSESRPGVGYADAFGVGTGIVGGAGVALFGQGTTQSMVLGEARAPHVDSVEVWAYGTGGGGGFGGLHDAGGDDRYVAQVDVVAERSATIGDGCECLGVEAVAHAGLGRVFAQGAASTLGAVGVLQDAQGHDWYSSNISTSAQAEARDERTVIPPPPPPPPGDPSAQPVFGAAATAKGTGAYSAVQAHGSVEGSGFLEDIGVDGSNDLYESNTRVSTSATATAVDPNAPAKAFAYSDLAWSEAQAAGGENGRALLRDVGGADNYRSTNDVTAAASPPTEEQAGPELSWVQASVDDVGLMDGWFPSVAYLIDADGTGGADSFTQDPAEPACQGVRGQNEWVDCGDGLGVGVNR